MTDAGGIREMTDEHDRGYKLDMVSVRLVQDAPILSDHKICTPEDAVEIMGKFLREMDREVMCVINLKADGTPINGHIASIGAINQTLAHPRELLKTAILSNAASMILLHSHPSGNVEPSRADVEVTQRMLEIGELMEIPLVDHIIVGGSNRDYFSFREKRLLRQQNCSGIAAEMDQTDKKEEIMPRKRRGLR